MIKYIVSEKYRRVTAKKEVLNMKYKVGDKVKIREDLKAEHLYGKIGRASCRERV